MSLIKLLKYYFYVLLEFGKINLIKSKLKRFIKVKSKGNFLGFEFFKFSESKLVNIRYINVYIILYWNYNVIRI